MSTDSQTSIAQSVQLLMSIAFPAQTPNGDETDPAIPNHIGNFHKCLPHDAFGEVDSTAYQSLLTAVQPPHNVADFELIELDPFADKLTSPQAGLAADREGPDPRSLVMPPAPKVNSAAAAVEMGELYWMAILRDVPFTRFDTDAGVAAAAADLSQFVKADHLHQSGIVTPQNIFRGFTDGDQKGPFISQFLLRDIPYGSLTLNQRQRTVAPSRNYMTQYDQWLAVQNGHVKLLPDSFDSTPRYIRNMRDMGQYVHVDALYEAYLNACLILLNAKAPIDAGNPYNDYEKQKSFATFGGPHILSLVCEVATRALKAVWFQKWIVHRRLRPEEYGGLVHLTVAGLNGTKKAYPLHQDIFDREAIHVCQSLNASYLLPMAFPEGCPTHPAYGAGHATVAGACVTILKAWFKDDAKLSALPGLSPIVPNEEGTELVPYMGADKEDLTIGGELDKVAANVAIGRNMAGVHWRSDYTESVKLGEQVAICILKRQSQDYHETPSSFSLRRFDGTTVQISGGIVTDENGIEIFQDC